LTEFEIRSSFFPACGLWAYSKGDPYVQFFSARSVAASSDSAALPADFSFEQLQKQAKDLLQSLRNSDPAAMERIAHIHKQPGSAYQLADAQFVLAANWALKPGQN